MNSFILTSGGASLVINGKPYTIDSTHHNYQLVIDKIRAKEWEGIPALINRALNLVPMAGGRLQVDVEGGVVLVGGQEVHNAAVDHLFEMLKMGFDGEPMCNFITNLYANPNPDAIAATFKWMQINNITISEDGHLIAYKRVQDDYTSFQDNKTMNALGTTVAVSRSMCDTNGNNTCSYGLHFCSHDYLPEYCTGRGRVLILKINPRDITAIPTDYGFAKGRACQYFVVGELSEEARVRVEKEPVLVTPVLTDATNVNASLSFIAGYEAGYKDGRGKKAMGTSLDLEAYKGSQTQYTAGYDEGRKDGRSKLPKRYGTSAVVVEPPPKQNTVAHDESPAASSTATRVCHIIAEMLGFPDAASVLPSMEIIADMGADSLDVVELTMAIEDEYDLDIPDEDAEKIRTVADVINYVQQKRGY